jgi:hypothetical protein
MSSKASKNAEGMTFAEWLAAAHLPEVDPPIDAAIAWARCEDPADWLTGT